MIDRIKVVGSIVGALLAICAIGASSAYAVEGEFTASEYPANITGEALKPYELKIAGKVVVCKSANSTSVEFGKSGIFTDKYTYFECSSAGMPATVTMNGCDYRRTAKPKKVSVLCPPLKNIELHVYANAAKHVAKENLCKYSIGEQEGLEGVEYENQSGLVEDLRIEDNLKGIKYTVEGSKLVCGSNGENGELLGNTTERAKNEGGTSIPFMVG